MENRTKRLPVPLLLAGLALLAGPVEHARAFSSYGSDLDAQAACANVTPKPFAGGGGSCGLCHASSKATSTPQKTAYLASNYGFFCPTANAGAAQTRPEGSAVSLSGAGSTGTIDAYAWTQTSGTAVTLSGASTVTAGFTTPQVGVGGAALGFLLTVSRTPGYSTTTVVRATSATSVTVTDVPAANLPPVASAGPAQTAVEGTLVTLDGSGSSDPESAALSYAWTQTSGPAVTLSSATAVRPTFTAPAVTGAAVVLGFQLVVSDGTLASTAATTTVSVTDATVPNQKPIANAGPPQTVVTGTPVTLDGSNSSDPEGGTLTYSWAQTAGAPVTLSNASAAKPSFTAPAVVPAGEAFTFRLTVTDSGGLTGTATTTVNVTHLNAPPSASAGTAQTVVEGTLVTLDGSNSSDPEGAVLTYAWTQTSGPSVTLSSSTAVRPTFTAPAVTGAAVALGFQLVVSDGALTASATTTVNVTDATAPNQTPTANAGPDQSVASGATVTLNGSNSSDPDGAIAAYLWTQTAGTSVTLSSTTSATPTFTAPGAGALTFRLTVTDNGGLSASDTVSVNVTEAAQGPAAASGPNQTVRPGATVTLDGSNSTGGTTYQWTQTAGASVTLSRPQGASTTFVAPAAGPALVFELRVTDADNLTSTDTVIVNVTTSATPPQAEAGPNQTVRELTQVTLNASASSGSDDDSLTYRWRQIEGVAVTLSNPAAARPTFTSPAVGQHPVALRFRLTVTDGKGLSDTDEVIVNVSNDERPPTADPGDDTRVTAGETRSLNGTGSSDPDETIRGYHWRQTRGTFVRLSDPEAASPTFTAPTVGASGEDLDFELTVTADSGLQDSGTVTYRVAASQSASTASDSGGGGGGGGGCFIGASTFEGPSHLVALGALLLFGVVGVRLRKR